MGENFQDSLNKLYFSQFIITYLPHSELQLPVLKENIFRGQFGSHLRTLFCVFHSPRPCKDCIVRFNCVYARLFETFPNFHQNSAYSLEKAPHPYVFSMVDPHKRLFKKNEPIEVLMTIIGSALEYIPYFILALENMGKSGIGKFRIEMDLKRIVSGQNVVYNGDHQHIVQKFEQIGANYWSGANDTPVSQLELELLTPLRIERLGKIAETIDFELLMRNVYRRLYLLSAFFCGGPHHPDMTDALTGLDRVKVGVHDVEWQKIERYSGRQHATMNMSGLLGRIVYQGELDAYRSALLAAEYLHIGKWTTFGLGKFKLRFNHFS